MQTKPVILSRCDGAVVATTLRGHVAAQLVVTESGRSLLMKSGPFQIDFPKSKTLQDPPHLAFKGALMVLHSGYLGYISRSFGGLSLECFQAGLKPAGSCTECEK